MPVMHFHFFFIYRSHIMSMLKVNMLLLDTEVVWSSFNDCEDTSKVISLHWNMLFSLLIFCPTKLAACQVKACPWHDIRLAYREKIFCRLALLNNNLIGWKSCAAQFVYFERDYLVANSSSIFKWQVYCSSCCCGFNTLRTTC